VQTQWLKGYKGDDKEARKKEVLTYRNAFEDLREILDSLIEDQAPDYDCPSWSHKQADINGYNRALRKVIKLTTIEDTK
jgi:hypothetical protein